MAVHAVAVVPPVLLLLLLSVAARTEGQLTVAVDNANAFSPAALVLNFTGGAAEINVTFTFPTSGGSPAQSYGFARQAETDAAVCPGTASSSTENNPAVSPCTKATCRPFTFAFTRPAASTTSTTNETIKLLANGNSAAACPATPALYITLLAEAPPSPATTGLVPTTTGVVSTTGLAPPPPPDSLQAYCRFSPTANGDQTISGFARLTQQPGQAGVQMQLEVQGITTNADVPHGVHIHTFGDLSIENGGTASPGSHYGQAQAAGTHGCPPDPNRALGDTGNWNVTGGAISMMKTLDLFSLSGSTSVIGRSIIIHANTDNCSSSGVPSSGSKLASCVIGIENTRGATTNIAAVGPGATAATCELKGTTNGAGISGRVHFAQASPSAPVTVEASIEGLIAGGFTGKHGFHVHTYGDLSVADGTGSGGHFNPSGSLHSLPDIKPRHVGDMGNVYYYNGTAPGDFAFYKFSNDYISLDAIVGRAVVLHRDEDTCGQPTGNAGSRLAICVIGLENTGGATAQPVIPAGVPTTQDSTACTVTPPNTPPPSEATSGAVGAHVVNEVMLAITIAAVYSLL